MSIGTQNKTNQEDQPLTRTDVERLLSNVGNSAKLNLSGQNLQGIDLSNFSLINAILSHANLGGADLHDANLTGAKLDGADLARANLHGANLTGANLQHTRLFGANLNEVSLGGADLSQANLDGATLRKAYLGEVDLSEVFRLNPYLKEMRLIGFKLPATKLYRANLPGADLRDAHLLGVSFHMVDLPGADFRGALVSEDQKEQLRGRGIVGLDEANVARAELAMTVSIRVLEDPLTAQNLNLIISALTELSTKYWLIAKGRFSDLIEYTQTHNGRFAEEANVVITKVSYNSPFNIDWKVDLSAPPVAEALVTTIDGITQRRERLEKTKLENQAKVLEIKDAEQKAEQENQMALLEQEKLRLELEQRRLEVLEKQLEVQKKGIEYALEIAGRVVDTLHPSADPATRAMEIQTLLPNLIQLQSGRGLELAFPTKSESAQ